MTQKPIFYLIILLVTLTFSCSIFGPGPDVVNIEWVNDGNTYIQYSTNDPAKYSSFFINPIPADTQNPYIGSTYELVRVSGHLGSGQGGLFCYQDADNYYRILISGSGSYNIVRRFAGTSTLLKPWTISPALLTGYNQVNKIEIQRVGLGNFTILINDAPSAIFTDTNLTFGTSAFIATTSSSNNEAFPYNTSDTRFKLTDPVVVP